MEIISYETILKHLHPFTDNYCSEEYLFLDIETTGLSKERHSIYLIGCAYFNPNHTLITKQFFAEHPDEEQEMLQQFHSFLSERHFSTVITFNGNSFDLRFIEKKEKKYQLPNSCKGLESMDLLKEIKQLNSLFALPNMRQKTLENFLGILRDDSCDGGQLISVYQSYAKNRDENEKTLLLLHNYEDVIHMPDLICLLAYKDFLQTTPVIINATCENFTNLEGNKCEELILALENTYQLPGNFHTIQAHSGIHIIKNNRGIHIRVPIHESYVKCYFTDYKNYYYLPAEDQAVHKSVATYVDKNCREKATLETCYTKIPVNDAFLHSSQCAEFAHHILTSFL